MAKSWDDANYTKRIQITVQHAYIDGNLADFPCLVKLTDAQAVAKADIASKRYDFYDHNGNRLAFEQESYSEGASYANASLWVKAGNLYTSPSGDQNKLWLYYGYDYGSDRDQPTSVWDANFKGVWHGGDATPTTLADSTTNANTGTKLAEGEPVEATGKVGAAQDYDGANDKVDVPYGSVGPVFASAFTVSMFIRPDSVNGTSGVSALFDKPFTSHVDPYYQVSFAYDTNQKILAYLWATGSLGVYLTSGPSSAMAPIGSWTHAAMTVDLSAPYARTFVNGVQSSEGTATSGSYTNYDSGMAFGRLKNQPAWEYDGLMEEMRISSITRSAAWLKFEYRNVAEADNELTWGSEETPAAVGNPWYAYAQQ